MEEWLKNGTIGVNDENDDGEYTPMDLVWKSRLTMPQGILHGGGNLDTSLLHKISGWQETPAPSPPPPFDMTPFDLHHSLACRPTMALLSSTATATYSKTFTVGWVSPQP